MPHRPDPYQRWNRLVLAAILPIVAGCTDMTQVDRTVAPAPPPAPRPPTLATAPPFPALARPGASYLGDPGIYADWADWHGGAPRSRTVLYDDGVFTLQFSSARHGLFQYAGVWTRTTDSTLTLDWGESQFGHRVAVGMLRGDTLAVEFTRLEFEDDFRNGDYILVRPTP